LFGAERGCCLGARLFYIKNQEVDNDWTRKKMTTGCGGTTIRRLNFNVVGSLWRRSIGNKGKTLRGDNPRGKTQKNLLCKTGSRITWMKKTNTQHLKGGE